MSNNIKRSSKVIYNGENYENLEDLPDEAKEFVEDNDNNGIPDFADDLIKNKGFKHLESSISINLFNKVNSKDVLPEAKITDVNIEKGFHNKKTGNFLNKVIIAAILGYIIYLIIYFASK